MKRFLAVAALAICAAGQASATGIAYDQNLANEVVTTTRTYTIPMGGTDVGGGVIDLLSASASISSVTTVSQSFTDGTPSTGSITVVSTSALVAAAGSDTITVTTNNALSPTFGSDSILISSGVAGSSVTVTTNKAYILSDGTQYTSAGQTTGQTATLLAAAVNTYVANVTATVSGSSVIITCNSSGVFCNSYALSSTSSTALTVATAKFAGGNDNASFNLNGHTFYQGSDWFQMAQASNTAVSILNAVTSLTAFTASTNTTTSVQIKCATAGSFCNAFTLTASTRALTISTAKFTGGQDNAFLKIANVVLTQGNQWSVVGSSVQVSTAIATAINADPTLSLLVTASAPSTCPNCGIVTVKGLAALTSNNYAWTSSSQSALSVTGVGLTGGTTAAYTLAEGDELLLPSHGLSTGMAVLYTSSTITITPLVNQTTYYAIRIDANNIELATTSTASIAGVPIVFTSSSTTGPHTFTLAALALMGTPQVTWQASNDNVNWGNLGVTVASFASPYTASTTIWDFGTIDFKFVRASVAGPTTGGVNLTIRGYGKRYGLGL